MDIGEPSVFSAQFFYKFKTVLKIQPINLNNRKSDEQKPSASQNLPGICLCGKKQRETRACVMGLRAEFHMGQQVFAENRVSQSDKGS